MALVFQALGFLVGGAVLARVLAAGSSRMRGRRSKRSMRFLKRFPLAGVGLVVALVAGVLFCYHVWQIGSGLPEATRAAAAVSLFEAEHAADSGANNIFLAWARNTMLTVTAHGSGTYYLEPKTVLEEPELGQWSTYELLPERATSKLSEADWIIFYGVKPILTTEQRRQFREVTQFAPDYALALRSNAR